MDIALFFKSLLLIALFLTLGNLIKYTVFRGYIVPSSLIAGLLALLLGPQLFGVHIDLSLQHTDLWIDDKVIDVWKSLPSYLIVVVFAGLFLGKKVPTIKQSLNQSLPNLGFGYTIAIGQYVVGMLTALLILGSLFETNAMAGALIAVGFQGGHGTVAGLKSTFDSINFDAGMDLGLGIATIGLISAIILGTLVSNRNAKSDQDLSIGEEDIIEVKKRPFSLNFAILCSVITLAWLILTGLQVAEQALFAESSIRLLAYMPLFPVAMLVGLGVQVLLNKIAMDNLVSDHQINLMSNLALDILIVAALGSLNLSVLAKHWQSILILGGIGVVYSSAVYFLLGRWFFDKNWQIRGIGEVGQSMGTTAVGLLLLKQASSNPKEDVQPFSYKQPLYEPIVGGGIVTALAIPAIANFGPWIFTAIMTTFLALIVLGFAYLKKRLKHGK